ncbi:MAG TPA: hypothetical protein VL979_01395 [Solirubrobacteraceae bacterium]|nr:hypothetical protein [Solirubrobacteraceae bacterium]
MFRRVADDRLDAAEDPFGFLLLAHAGGDLGGEDEAGVKAAGLLDPGGHAGHRYFS